MTKAATTIRYGVERDEVTVDGSTHEAKTINPGEDVDKSLFSDEEWADLEAAGALYEEGEFPQPSPQATGPLLDENPGMLPSNANGDEPKTEEADKAAQKPDPETDKPLGEFDSGNPNVTPGLTTKEPVKEPEAESAPTPTARESKSK
jgi:hypothetical protein